MSAHTEFAALVAAVATEGDQGAFSRLFDHFGARLHAYLLRLGTDPTVAEEITQDVMVTLWRKAPQFDAEKSSVATWLYRIARNRRIDLLRRNRIIFLDTEDRTLEFADESGDLDRLVDIQQREEAVRHALHNLPPEQLALVRLAFFEGLTHSQISERTGLPLGTVKSRIRLAVTRLRRALVSDGVAEAG